FLIETVKAKHSPQILADAVAGGNLEIVRMAYAISGRWNVEEWAMDLALRKGNLEVLEFLDGVGLAGWNKNSMGLAARMREEE
ncbi:hypothetical protein HDU97_009104, partial [Phlyctochytrium planicorne]